MRRLFSAREHYVSIRAECIIKYLPSRVFQAAFVGTVWCNDRHSSPQSASGPASCHLTPSAVLGGHRKICAAQPHLETPAETELQSQGSHDDPRKEVSN